MPHDPTNIKEVRKLASADKEYELVEFARKYDLQADALIMLHGPSRGKLDEVMRQEIAIVDDTTGR